MQAIARYLTHPEVRIDPKVDLPLWGLSDKGHARIVALAGSRALVGTTAIISSAETKALETARPLAEALGCGLQIRVRMHENDRSATGFLPPAEFEAVADRFFGEPDKSIRGWETARAAQARILSEVQASLAEHSCGDILFIGHGGVGTLLYCALCHLGISREYDQGPGGGGNFFAFNLTDRRPRHGWRPLEALLNAPAT